MNNNVKPAWKRSGIAVLAFHWIGGSLFAQASGATAPAKINSSLVAIGIVVAILAFTAMYASLKFLEEHLDCEIPLDRTKMAEDCYIEQVIAGNGTNLRVFKRQS